MMSIESNPFDEIVQAAKIKADQRREEENAQRKREEQEIERKKSCLLVNLSDLIFPVLEQARESLESAGIAAETGNGNDPATKEPRRTLRIGSRVLTFQIEKGRTNPMLTYKSGSIHDERRERLLMDHPCNTEGSHVMDMTKGGIEAIIREFITETVK